MAVVILDSDQIPHGISRKFVKFPGEAQDHFYNRVTHLHHQGQKICQIGDLSVVRNLTVLYLYDNKIEKIEHLDAVPHLAMLYLQRNKISVIENIGHFKKLKKLYLSNNRISVIENLEELTNLQGNYAHCTVVGRLCNKYTNTHTCEIQRFATVSNFYRSQLHIQFSPKNSSEPPITSKYHFIQIYPNYVQECTRPAPRTLCLGNCSCRSCNLKVLLLQDFHDGTLAKSLYLI